ncbi:type II toxin-antitoxin system HicB family antitoxin [Candidatus Berkelbacteria bacterium]|nr:type II toxin-antitoxin system HicB family antitoxin [Candidatus Berkelbacteria bacterium]
MLTTYLNQQLQKARYKILEDRTYFGEIPGLPGVWANASTLEECRNQLTEVLEDWLILKIRDGEAVSGLKLSYDRRDLVKHA